MVNVRNSEAIKLADKLFPFSVELQKKSSAFVSYDEADYLKQLKKFE